MAWYEDWSDLLKNIIWNDEAVFHFGGFVNRYNRYYWTGEDANITSVEMLNQLKVSVLCGMISDRIVGPFILRDTMNAKRYLTMLRDEIWPVICRWENVENLIFMQDDVPPQFAIVVREWLNAHFHWRWMGRDLAHCSFFLFVG